MDPHTHQSEQEVEHLSSGQKENKSQTAFLVLAASVIVILFLVFLYLYTAHIPKAIAPTPMNDEVVKEVEDEAPPVNLADLQIERLAEIDEGQGLIDITLDSNQQLIMTTADGHTLYQRTEGFCEAECLNTWLPYSSTYPYAGLRLSSVLVNEEFNLHYVLLDNRMLFTYVGDQTPGDRNGEGVDPLFEVVKP